MKSLSIEEMAVFCKKKGFVFPNSEIYGGFSGFWDYGPLGVELKNSIKAEWWRAHVHAREDILGMDGSILAHPRVWQASGHVAGFTDALLECSQCRHRVRADQFIEEHLKMDVVGLPLSQIDEIVKHHRLKCPKCKGLFRDATGYNLMFRTHVGPADNDASVAYLRPETAQLIFADFKAVADTSRVKLPFGIAQIGKAFRNEISPRDFLFRCREFEQMEIEYFIHPGQLGECPYIGDFMDYELNILSAEMQEKKQQPRKMKVKEALESKVLKTPWHGYWLAFEHRWFVSLGANPDNFRIRQHLEEEKSHYALDTWDLEYHFPFGWKELEGMANRTNFDLMQHIKESGKDLAFFNQESNAKVVPHVVAEPSLGVERAFLVFMFDAYCYDEKRGNVVLKLHPRLAPYKAAVVPLLSNKEELVGKARLVHSGLKGEFPVFYDQSGSIGRRYARQDEVGTPLCITVDFETLKDDTVTLRDRDTTRQVRVPVETLPARISAVVRGEPLEGV